MWSSTRFRGLNRPIILTVDEGIYLSAQIVSLVAVDRSCSKGQRAISGSEGLFTETTASYAPNSPYSASKARIGQLVDIHDKSLSVVEQIPDHGRADKAGPPARAIDRWTLARYSP